MSMMLPLPSEAQIRWRRLDALGHEIARIERLPSGWCLSGDVVVDTGGVAAKLRYAVECDAAWHTRSAIIEDASEHHAFHLTLFADGSGHWTHGGQPLPQLDGTLDVDLSFTPATNTLPIRRLSLRVGMSASVSSVWVRFPDLRIERLEQTYTREMENTYRYRALVDGETFVARLDTDAFGRVLNYEGLWVAEATSLSR